MRCRCCCRVDRVLLFRISIFGPAVVGAFVGSARAAGPYSSGLQNTNPGAIDPAIPGFIGSAGLGRTASPNVVNPAFVGWASSVVDYSPAPGVSSGFGNPSAALGPVTGNNFDIVSLGDLSATQIAANVSPGQITLSFASGIRNAAGPDFAVFENSLVAGTQVFGEFAYVEVSSDGQHFARFGTTSLTPGAVGAFGTIDPTNVHNLPGKHVNNGGDSWGTPLDLAELSADPLVISGQVNLNGITSVRFVDIPGNGSYLDSDGRPIYDAWPTQGSGGFDLEAIGVTSAWLGGDANLDGIVNISDLGALASHWQQAASWDGGDFNHDGIVDIADLGLLAANWQSGVATLSDELASLGLPVAGVPEPACAIASAIVPLLALRRRKRVRSLSAALVAAGVAASTNAASLVDFEDLSLPAESFYNGADGAGGFVSRGASFNNTFTDFGGGFSAWKGFAYSNRTDASTPGFANQYSSIAGGGADGSSTYGIGFAGGGNPPTIGLPAGASPVSVRITNNAYAYYSMRDGDAFAKKFGGASGNDPDYLKLSIEGFNAAEDSVGVVDFYLADFRFAVNTQDYIVNSWQGVDLTPLAGASSLTFTIESSDVGMFGINTPTYFAIDDLSLVPEPATSLSVIGIVCAWNVSRRKLR